MYKRKILDLVSGEGLLGNDVAAQIQSADDILMMKGVYRGDNNDVGLGLGNHLVKVMVYDAVFPASSVNELLTALVVDVVYTYQLGCLLYTSC